MNQFGPQTKQHLASIRDMVEADCQEVDCPNPKDAKLDSLSFAAYLRSRGASDLAVSTGAVWTRAMLGQEPEDVSALYFLNYCKSGGGLLQMRSDRKHGGQYLRVRQGTQLFSKGLAADLPNGTIQLNSTVTAVEQSNDGRIVVHTQEGRISARKVISAIPQTVLRQISFEPALPYAKALLTGSFNYGYYTKVMMSFKKPFWSDKGFCGLIQSLPGPAAVIRDTSVPVDKKWVLTCFMAGRPGREWSLKSQDERTSALLAQINDIWGGSEDIRHLYLEQLSHEWPADKFAGFGCPCPSLAPGVLDAVGHALREPVGNLHFAGTETAAEWKGYMEGAVRSGERAAKEVVSGLKIARSKL